ncbi:MAG: DnaJ domain-containing protein [Candidatus Poribacteria bacterium]|nr:DnaJ domain-containing protein [Candidatus Poribacteria bacterium]
MSTPDYYQTLEIDRHATPGAIKQAFRRLAKEYHPDKNPTREKFAEKMFREISTAYDVLRDPKERFKYDLTLSATIRNKRFRSRHREDFEYSRYVQYRFGAMFQQLLTQNYEVGIQIYEQLQRGNKEFRIDDFLDYENSRDCEFLIGEAYQTLGDLPKATHIYESLLASEKRRPVFHHFAGEIRDRLKRIYCYALADPVHIESIPNNLEKIRALKLSKRETAWVYKKLAEFYCEINWLVKAQEMLQMALELHPRLKGTKKLCQKLGLENQSCQD